MIKKEGKLKNLDTLLPESNPELSGHGAVEDEVDHAVHQGHHVHQLQEKNCKGGL